MPGEQRNMVSFMMKSGASYENYEEYQTIDRNKSALLPSSFEPVVAETANDDYNSNITIITEMVLNERSKMVKKATVQPNGAASYPGWQLIADEGFEEGVNTFGPYLKKVTVSFNTSASETWELYSDELNGTDGSPMAPTSLEYVTAGTALCLTSQLTLVSAMMDLDCSDFRVEQQIDYREENVDSSSMAGFTDIVHSSVMIESDETDERLNQFYNKSLALCFAGEAFKGATNMYTHCYQNAKEIK